MQASVRTLYLADDGKHVRSMVVRVGRIVLYGSLAGFCELGVTKLHTTRVGALKGVTGASGDHVALFSQLRTVSVSIPRNHYYVPVFYLKQWTGADGRLCEHKRVAGRTVTRRTFPSGTGYERDLYRVKGLPEALAQAVESQFMHLVDTEANYALHKVVSGDTTPWDSRMRSSWTRFILSLRFRNPEAVHVIKRQMQDVWKAGIDNLQTNYDKLRRATDPLTFDEFIALAEPEAPYKAALMLLQQIIDNQRVGPTIFNMHWSRVSLTAASLPLLTSDRPLNLPYGLASQEAYIALPIGPSMLFVAGHDATWAKRLSAANPSAVVKSVNLAVVSAARKFVWGLDNGQLKFVRSRMSTAQEQPIITDEQRQQAINAAAGR
jgi:hypothetical protein